MSSIGLIANPASGRDIRRLVAKASVFDNGEKANIIKRILAALDAIGVDQATIMPDSYGLGKLSLEGMKFSHLHVDLLEMPVSGTSQDSSLAAGLFSQQGVGCIVVLGGDGTNRVVSKNSASTPILPISTGTNNAFPSMVEGTIAGLAAGLVATGQCDPALVCYRARRIEIFVNKRLVDIALVDVVTSTDTWIGTRAIWEISKVRDIVLAGVYRGNIGFSSIGSLVQNNGNEADTGMYLQIGPGGFEVQAPIAPGVIAWVPVADYRSIGLEEEIPLRPASMIALDGEREIELPPGADLSVCLSGNGPVVIDIQHCLANAAKRRLFQRIK